MNNLCLTKRHLLVCKEIDIKGDCELVEELLKFTIHMLLIFD